MIKNSPMDCYETVLKTTGVIMERIHALLQMEVSWYLITNLKYLVFVFFNFNQIIIASILANFYKRFAKNLHHYQCETTEALVWVNKELHTTGEKCYMALLRLLKQYETRVHGCRLISISISGRWCQRGTTTFTPLWHIA